MHRRTPVGVVLAAAAMACGSVARPGEAQFHPSVAPATSSPFGPSADQSVITVVVRHGADPQAATASAGPAPLSAGVPFNKSSRGIMLLDGRTRE